MSTSVTTSGIIFCRFDTRVSLFCRLIPGYLLFCDYNFGISFLLLDTWHLFPFLILRVGFASTRSLIGFFS